MVNNTTKPEQLTCIVHDLVIIQCLKSVCVAMSGKRRTSDLNVTGSQLRAHWPPHNFKTYTLCTVD